jgi:hypothetical protein
MYETIIYCYSNSDCPVVYFQKQPGHRCRANLPASHATAVVNDTISFVLQIQPILVNHCSPCHFSGGKMYDRLPFDEPGTIIHDESGLLRRITNDKEKELIRDFISQQSR